MTAPQKVWQSLPPAWLDRAVEHSGSVLLHNASPSAEEHESFLFADPVRVLSAATAADMLDCLDELERALADGFYAAGYITYEAGVLLQGGLPHPLMNQEPLLWFGIYRDPQRFEHRQIAAEQANAPEPTEKPELALLPAVSLACYREKIAQVQRWIADGDTYQVNYTIPLRGETAAEPKNIYAALVQEQASSYAAVVHPSPGTAPVVLSFSPELFFKTGPFATITVKPMKGTAPRSPESTEDKSSAQWLGSDEKNRAEHVMIVDLLRNDLGRICEVGSVQTANLFQVSTYQTLHQMTTTVTGTLRPNLKRSDIFRALLPSGSITGAPKLRTMQLIQALEDEPRGVYTGAIGYFAPDGSSRFSVPIRTLQLRRHEQKWNATLGVGGGIVADSQAEAEYAECLLKSAFVRRGCKPLQLVETMRCDDGVLRFQAEHLQRMGSSAEELGFTFDLTKVNDAILQAVRNEGQGEAQQVRLTLTPSGETSIRFSRLQHWPETLRVRLSQTRSALGDPTLWHKTSFRPSYDQELAAAKQAGFHESLFTNDAGLLTEGCITSLFLLRGQRLVTPLIQCGVLPGVLRSTVLQQGLVDESVIPLEELGRAEVVILGNSLRGFYPVQSLALPLGRTLTFDTERALPFCQELESIFPPVPKP